MYKKLKNNFVLWENGNIGHRPLFKIILNNILRILQFYTDTPFVIGTKCKIHSKDNIEFHGYTFEKVKHNKRGK